MPAADSHGQRYSFRHSDTNGKTKPLSETSGNTEASAQSAAKARPRISW